MFWQLFKKEFKYIFKDITFYIFIIFVLIFYQGQFLNGSAKKLRPLPPEELIQKGKAPSYGYKQITDPKKEIKVVYLNLYRDYKSGEIYKTRIGINVHVKLSDEEKQYIKKSMNKIASDELLDKEDYSPIKVSYDEYLKIIRDLDEKFGGSTQYGDKQRIYLLSEPKNYDEAIKEFEEILQKDKITNAKARLFSDYMGVTAGLFPVFLSAFMFIKAKKYKMEELICTRSVSSYNYVISKFAALSAAIMIPYFIVASHATFVFYKIGRANNFNIDILAFYKYTLWWVLPTALFTISIGMLLSLIFNSGIAVIPVQFVLWYESMMPLRGDYSLSKFVIRFNGDIPHSSYAAWSNNININRTFYIIFSIVIILITCLLWTKKRGDTGEHIK